MIDPPLNPTAVTLPGFAKRIGSSGMTAKIYNGGVCAVRSDNTRHYTFMAGRDYVSTGQIYTLYMALSIFSRRGMFRAEPCGKYAAPKLNSVRARQ